MSRPELTADDVWTLIAEGCNAREIAEYARVTLSAAIAMMQHATRYYAHAA